MIAFWRKNQQTKPNHDSDVEEKLKEIEKQLESLLSKEFQQTINIEELHIHDPVLENLTFRLDSLDIKELSGALNLGNNFAPTVKKGDKKGKQGTPKQNKEHKQKKSKPRKNEEEMEQTSNGYRVKL